MKKYIGFEILTLMCALCGCSNSGTKAQKTGIVECESIKLSDGGLSIDSYAYNVSYSAVYEYKNSSGKIIYTDEHKTLVQQDTTTGNITYNDANIRVYSTRYTQDYTEYKYVGFVGWLLMEKNYYLDLDNKTIDMETKWGEYSYPKNPSDEIKADNKKAYKCAKNGYYLATSLLYAVTDNETFYALCTEIADRSLERHQYVRFGENCVVTYRPKWY